MARKNWRTESDHLIVWLIGLAKFGISLEGLMLSTTAHGKCKFIEERQKPPVVRSEILRMIKSMCC